jgi:polygalacturonase
MRLLNFGNTSLILAVILSACNQAGNVNPPAPSRGQQKVPETFSISEPQISDNTVSIIDFGAVSDGQTLNTKAIADAIDKVSRKGGGKVIIPRGLWLTGPIILKSNINIHIKEGALVIFSPDKSLYPLIETSFEGLNTVRCTSPIYGYNLENIAFTGKGIFDGTGEAWRPVKKEKLTESQWKNLVKSGGVVSEDGKNWYPSESFLEGQKMSQMNVPRQLNSIKDYENIKDFLRPVMVSLVNCKKVLFDGPVFQNSPAWCIHPLMCEDLTVRNITVKNPWFSQNGDGIDIESCRNSIVYDSNFDVGDDAICIKSGKDADGRKRGKPTENLIIRNCIVYHGHGGVTIGSEMSGGVRNMKVSDCTFIGTDVGIRFKSNRGRGGVVEDISFDNIDMINIPTQSISFNLYYGGLSPSEMMADEGNEEEAEEIVPPITEETPLFRDITIRNVTCKGALQAVFLQGLPEQNLENIGFENIDIEAVNGMTCIDANGVLIKGMRLITKNSPAISINNSQRIDIEKLDLPATGSTLIYIKGGRSKNIKIESESGINKSAVGISRECDAGTIKIL